MNTIVMAILVTIIYWSGYGLGYITGVIKGREQEE